jgi:uncharacterized protein
MPLLLDAPTMGACIPGCTELVQVDEANYSGRLVNEVAHVRFNAAFSAEITARDAQEVRAILRGEDKKLASSLKLDATLRVVPDGETSTVSYAIEMAMWGKLGRMGESIFRRRTAEVEKEFVAAFTRACKAQQADGMSTVRDGFAAAGPAPAPELQAGPAPRTAAASSSGPESAAARSGGIWQRLIAFLGRWTGRR